MRRVCDFCGGDDHRVALLFVVVSCRSVTSSLLEDEEVRKFGMQERESEIMRSSGACTYK